MMKILLIPLTFFAFNPIPVFIVAVFFAVLYFTKWYSQRSRKIFGIVAVIWAFYGGWEIYMTLWRSSTGDMAIRVDLILFGPVFLITALVGIWTFLFGSRHKNNMRDENL